MTIINRIDAWLIARIWQPIVNLTGRPRGWLMQLCALPSLVLYVCCVAPLMGLRWWATAILGVLLIVHALLCFSLYVAANYQPLMDEVGRGEHAPVTRACPAIGFAVLFGLGLAHLADGEFAPEVFALALSEAFYAAGRYFAGCDDPPPPRHREDMIPEAS